MENMENFEDMLNATFKEQKKIELGDRVSGIVSGIDNESVYLDISPRVQGVVNKHEFIEENELNVSINDEIMVYVMGKTKGFLKCSRRLGAGENDNSNIPTETYTVALKEAYENGVPVEGKITKVLKGGFEVSVMGKRTFCPISQIDINYCDNPNDHLNKSYSFLISEYKEDRDDFVLSRKQILIEEAEKKEEKLWESIKENMILDGVVTSIKSYGAFVDIGGIEGLLHISEISHERTDDVSQKLKKGDLLKVEIINIDRTSKKIGLSLKSQSEDPSIAILKELQEGDILEGTVVRLKQFGAFVNLFTNIDGLVHISKLGVDKRVNHAKEVLSIGDKVTVKILEIDRENGKISLTMEEEEQNYDQDLKSIKDSQSINKKGAMADLFDGY